MIISLDLACESSKPSTSSEASVVAAALLFYRDQTYNRWKEHEVKADISFHAVTVEDMAVIAKVGIELAVQLSLHLEGLKK